MQFNAYDIFAILTALAFGSFVNVLIYRIPKDQSILSPGSHCTSCNYFLKWYEKIPILSFFFLKGKCSNCGAKISSHYPLIELVTALCFIPFISNSHPKENLFVLIVLSIVLSLGMIDYQKRILPLGLSFAGIILVCAFTILQGPYFYLAPSSFLSKTVIVLKNLGIIMFLLDAVVHLSNKFFFKERGESISSSALHFRFRFLDKNISWVYLLILAVMIALYFKAKFLTLDYLFAAIGLSYLINEIIFDYFLLAKNHSAQEKNTELESKKTILGGGDIAMMGFIAVTLGYINALFVLLAAFYICFIFLLIKKLKNFFSKSKVETSSEIAFGPALALAMIADMILIRGII